MRDALRDLAHEAFLLVGARGLMAVGEPFGRFVNHVPPDRRLELDVRGVKVGVVEELLRTIANPEVRPSAVLVPRGDGFIGWEGPASGTAGLSLDDARKVLPVLAGLDAGSISTTQRSALARQVVAALGDSARRLDGDWSDLALFLGRNHAEPDSRLLSLRELTTARGRRLLFSGDCDDLAATLEASLHVGGVVVDESGVANHLFGDVKPCDPMACLHVLSQRPPAAIVTSMRPRTELLRRLLKPLSPDEIKQNRFALRYLLHGDRDRIGFDDPLFAGIAPGLSPVWRTLGRRILTIQGGGWRTVADTLPDFLQGPHGDTLKVRPLDLDAVVGMIRKEGAGRLDVADLSADDRHALVRECKTEHFDVIKALPIHQTIDGRLVPLDGRTYWRGGYSVPGDLPEGIVLVKPADDRELRARQETLHDKILDAKAFLKLILESPDPASRWRMVVEVLDSYRGEIELGLKGLLRRTPWLPVEGEAPASPEEVIWINPSHSQELIRDVLTDVQPSEDVKRGVPLLSLVEELRDPERFKDVSARFDDRFVVRERDLKRLGQILETDERYRIGPFDAASFEAESFLRVFENAPGDVMRCHRLVRHLCEEKKAASADKQGQISQFRKNLLPQLLGELSAERFVAVLGFLADDDGRCLTARKESRWWFTEFLRSAVRMPGFRAHVLPRIRLKDREGAWRRPEELSFRAEGVADRYLVDPEQAEILKPVLPDSDAQADEEPDLADARPGSRPSDEEIDQSAERLVEQARIWASASGLTPEAVGGFLALLGGHEVIVGEARRYLGNRQIAGVLDKLGWKEVKTYRGDVKDRGDAPDRMNGQRFVFEFNATKTVTVVNLLGEQVSRPMREDFEHLWLGSTWHGNQPYRIDRLQLRALSADQVPDGPMMASLLKETASRLLDGVYHQKNPDGLDDLWGELVRGEQLDVAVAQSRILRNAFGLLRGMGVPRRGMIHKSLQIWEDAQRHRSEADGNRAQGRVSVGSAQRADELETESIEGLRAILVGERGDEPVGVLLDAVRDKIFQYEYEPDSVPFELFQNADDASVELVRMCGEEAANDQARRFMLLASQNELCAVHEGRQINKWRHGDFDGREFGFDDDLVKMLQLNWSDKSNDSNVSGRFGLGFKSVFLISDVPRVLSGRLAFEIAAGLYPKKLDDEARCDAETRLGELTSTDRAREGTLFEFPLRANIDSDQIAVRFARSAHVLVVFARRLRTCVVQLPGQAAAKAEWRERELPGVPGAFVGRLRPASEDAGREMPALVLREVENGPGALLLGLDAHGFIALPKTLPSIWATAPLREESGFGLALNADLDLNPGRALLAQDPARNDKTAAKLGRDLGTRLVALFDAAGSDWATIRESLGLAPDTVPEGLWRSLWEITRLPRTRADNPAGNFLLRTIWGGDDQGMRRLIVERDALPTGLPGPYDIMTRLDRVAHAAGGLLADPEVFEEVARWPGFAAKHAPGAVISLKVARALKRLMNRVADEVSLTEAVRAELSGAKGGDPAAEPSVSGRLGPLLNTKFMQADREGTERKDLQALADLLKTIMFRASDGCWQRAGELLIVDEGHAVESARALFAPPGSVLHPDYDADGREFVRACRPAQRMNAPVGSVANWAWEADETRRARVIEYLAQPVIEGSSELANRLREDIIQRRRDGWIARLAADSPYLGLLDDWQKKKLLTDLGIDEAPRPVHQPNSPPPLPPGDALRRIHDWAIQNREEIQIQYENSSYIDGRPDWCDSGPGDELATRRDWLILLAQGAMHTMGRMRIQHGGGFLRFCSDRGYLDTFAEPIQDLGAWMNVVHSYLEQLVQESEYYHWMGQFVPIFQLSRWLRDYGELFLSLDRWDEARLGRFTLSPRLAPLTDPHSSVEAPPLTRVLGIGACFVLRELVRANVIGGTRCHLHPYCYPPYRRVIRLLKGLGCEGLDELVSGVDRLEQSVNIHNQLRRYLGDDRAQFGGLFDLPLLRLADDARLRERVLGTTIPAYDFITDDELEGPTC